MNPLSSIYDLDLPELTELVSAWGEPPYRARQIWQGLYQQLWSAPAQFSNLPKELRSHLEEGFARPGEPASPDESAKATFSRLQPGTVLVSQDGETRKTLFRLPDGFSIEAVLMRYDQRRTLCISTQAGCAMGCVFCATGQMGFKRHLSSGEIVEQVLYYARMLAEEGQAVSNIVLMGMGEPFHNYEATMQAIDRLNDPQGMSIGARRFTVSTVGLVPLIRRFANQHRQVNLAVSLHAADDELRTSMLPVNRKYPLEELFSACRDYVETTHRRITFEWALIQGVNDTTEQAAKLAAWLKGIEHLCHVNAIPLNPTRMYIGKATDRQRAAAFRAALEKHGIACTIRMRRGIDIQAGCGQLAGKISEAG